VLAGVGAVSDGFTKGFLLPKRSSSELGLPKSGSLVFVAAGSGWLAFGLLVDPNISESDEGLPNKLLAAGVFDTGLEGKMSSSDKLPNSPDGVGFWIIGAAQVSIGLVAAGAFEENISSSDRLPNSPDGARFWLTGAGASIGLVDGSGLEENMSSSSSERLPNKPDAADGFLISVGAAAGSAGFLLENISSSSDMLPKRPDGAFRLDGA